MEFFTHIAHFKIPDSQVRQGVGLVMQLNNFMLVLHTVYCPSGLFDLDISDADIVASARRHPSHAVHVVNFVVLLQY